MANIADLGTLMQAYQDYQALVDHKAKVAWVKEQVSHRMTMMTFYCSFRNKNDYCWLFLPLHKGPVT